MGQRKDIPAPCKGSSKAAISSTADFSELLWFLAKREKHRSDKNFDQADLMRDKLKEIGLLIKDGDDSAWYWKNSWRN